MGPIALAFGILGLPNGSANMLGLVLGATTVVFLLMAPFGGVIADKYGRARMVGLTDMVAGLILFVQVYYFATGQVPIAVLLIVNGSFGILWGIFWPAFAGIMPSVLPEQGLQSGNAINSLVSNGGIILVAASAGILIDTFGAAVTLGIDVSFPIVGIFAGYTAVVIMQKFELNNESLLIPIALAIGIGVLLGGFNAIAIAGFGIPKKSFATFNIPMQEHYFYMLYQIASNTMCNGFRHSGCAR